MKGQNIVFFSSDDWGWKTSKYQLSIRFAKDNKVLFVSSIGFRSPKANAEDLGRIYRKLKSFFRGVEQVENNLYVLTPIVIPFSWFPMKENINKLIFKMQLSMAMHKLEMKERFVFAFSQNWLPFVKDLGRKKLIYYCVDEQSSFGGLDGEKFQQQDQAMLDLADHVFYSAKKLYEKKKALNAGSHYMPHGVNYAHFSKAVTDNLIEPKDLKPIKRPRLLFFGHISYDWVDHVLLKEIAQKRPDYQIVLVGRYSMDENEFDGYENIHWLGEKDFKVLPAYCQYSDVGLIPFVDSELTANCNPLKLPEYVSAGLPVVSSAIPEVGLHDRYATVADDVEGFIDAIDEALTDEKKRLAAECSAELEKATWECRVDQIYDVVVS